MCVLIITERCINIEKVNGEDKAVSGSMVENMESEDFDNKMDDIYDGKFCDSHSLDSLKAGGSEAASPRISWADMGDEDGLEEEEPKDSGLGSQGVDVSSLAGNSMKTPQKRKLSRKERERYRFMNVKKMKVFSCFEKVRGRSVNILEGLELHTGVFSAVEQKKIVDFVYELQEKGQRGELRGSFPVFLITFCIMRI